MDVILCIAPLERWKAAQEAGTYRTESLEDEGFIHASTLGQVCTVAERVYPGRQDLVLLRIDPARLTAELRYEGKPGGELYPHLYGPLNLDAVLEAVPFGPGPDGRFHL